MIRTVINLPAEDKMWLDQTASQQGVAMTEVVRWAVRHFRQTKEAEKTPFQTSLSETSGLWQHGDGLVYQEKLRQEWQK